MLRTLFACSFLIVSLLPTRGHAQTDFSFLTAEENAFVRSELARLSLEQKAGQMTQVAVDLVFEGPTYFLTKPPVLSEERLQRIVGDIQVGSILNHPSRTYPTPAEFRTYIAAIQAKAMEATGVPLLYGQDAIHGVNYVRGATLYAQPLGVAASFNTDLARELAAMTAYEMKAASIPWNFSPAMDAGRNPAWARTWESFGENTFVNQQFGLAMVNGYQGTDLTDDASVAACLKHFTGYGATVSGRDRTPAYLPERQLREHYLPQYRAAIEAGALTVMINSGEINGIPVHVDKHLLTDVLRGELGFEGLLVSDWQDVRYLYERHRVARSLKEAVKLSIEAGMDMSMTAVTTDFPQAVVELVKEGELTMERIDQSVARILAVKVALGLYAQNVWDPAEFPRFGGAAHNALARRSAEQAIVLLKNDGLALPLDGDRKIFLTGPTADNMRSLNGGWTYNWQGLEADDYLGDYHTIKEAMMAEFGDRLTYAPGIAYDTLIDVEAGLAAAREADVIVAAMGELSYTEDPGDINDLNLPDVQRDYFKQLAELGKPIVLLMAGGRPRLITEMAEKSPAVLFLPYPGPHGGDALAGILAGKVNPSGRLPLTYPRYPNAFVYDDRKYTEDRNGKYNPLFPFGHGLSYTTFEYAPLEVSSKALRPDEILTIGVRVTNTGERAGGHSVILFASDLYATVTPSVRQVKGFARVELAPGESQTVTFELTPEDFSFIGLDLKPVTEPGTFRLAVGDKTAEFDYEN